MRKATILIFICFSFTNIQGRHFNGGTIRWEPINPSINSAIVPINIIQTYSWAYPTVSCAKNVPMSTSTYSSSNGNLICSADCSTNGGYSSKPVSILTDCISTSAALGLMTSQRTVSINLTANASFHLSNVGSAWAPLGYPTKTGLQWTITTLIDLRPRPDGLINTPPTASVVSPQYAIVNRTVQITIPVSDANAGDDVRCRWSTYTAGYRRRRSLEEESTYHLYQSSINKKSSLRKDIQHYRMIRGAPTCDPKKCSSSCAKDCSCTACTTCGGTTCSGAKCSDDPTCLTGTTTLETPGTVKSTSSYPSRQAIDECGGICFPAAVPNTTTLSGCTISFTGLVPGAWYAVAIQVEDFLNSTSTTALSSVPVQMLIYVMDAPTCNTTPVVLPLNRCLDVQVGVSVSFNISAMSFCNPNISVIADIIVSTGIDGMNVSDTVSPSSNASIAYNTYTWTPSSDQIGSQKLCLAAFSDEYIQSSQYCVTFNVITSSSTCMTTTTALTTSTTKTTSSTSSTSTSTSTSSTSTTSTTATSTTTSTTSTSSSTSTSATTTTTGSSATTSTSSSSSSTSSTSSSTSTSTTSTTTTSQTTSTSSSTSMTTVTTVTVTTTKKPKESINWLLLSGLSLLTLLLAVCCACACLYCFRQGLVARKRRRRRSPNFEMAHFSPKKSSNQTIRFDQDSPNSLNVDQTTSIFQLQSQGSNSSSFKSTTQKNPSSVARKANHRVEVKRISSSNKPEIVGNPLLQPPFPDDQTTVYSPNRYSAVTVKRLPRSNK